MRGFFVSGVQLDATLPEFQIRQIWDPRIRAYRLVRVEDAEMKRLRFVREENQRRQQQHLSRCPRAVLVS